MSPFARNWYDYYGTGQEPRVVLTLWSLLASLLGNKREICLINFLFGKSLNLLWQIFYAIGQIYIPINGQILQNSLAIWVH